MKVWGSASTCGTTWESSRSKPSILSGFTPKTSQTEKGAHGGSGAISLSTLSNLLNDSVTKQPGVAVWEGSQGHDKCVRHRGGMTATVRGNPKYKNESLSWLEYSFAAPQVGQAGKESFSVTVRTANNTNTIYNQFVIKRNSTPARARGLDGCIVFVP